jgi:hypothetical protein
MCGLPLCLVPDEITYAAAAPLPEDLSAGEFLAAPCRACAR